MVVCQVSWVVVCQDSEEVIENVIIVNYCPILEFRQIHRKKFSTGAELMF